MTTTTTPESDPVSLRPLGPAEAGALGRCFERCYGASYVDEGFYDPAEIRARLADGRLSSIIATNGAGEVVGHMGLSRTGSDSVPDAGNTVVDPRYRSRQLAARLGARLVERCRELGHVGFLHYPTTAHPIMQRLAVAGGGVETGLLLQYIPATTDYRELSGESRGGRLAAVVVYQPIGVAPTREVYCPEAYRSLVGDAYRRAGLTRHLRAADAPCAGTSVLAIRRDVRRDRLRIEVERAGTDLADRVEEAVAREPSAVVHVDLALADPCAPDATARLRGSGFRFAALLPESRSGDTLRLQRLADASLGAGAGELVHDEARAILARIRGEGDA